MVNGGPTRDLGTCPLLNRIITVAGELGWLNALLYGANRAISPVCGRNLFFRYVLVAQPVPAEPILPARRGRSITVRFLGEGDNALQRLPLTGDVLRYRFGQGAVCLGAFRGDALIGCLWLCPGAYDEDEVRARFIPAPEGRTAWDFDVYLAPDQRGGLGFMRLWDEANAYLRESGIAWSVSRISAFNPGSLGAHKRLSARVLARALFIRLGGWQLAFASVRPRLHLSLTSRSRPVYRLSTSGL